MKILPKRKQIRLKDYDYSSNGWYYLTICAQKHQCLFGEIIDGIVKLNGAGKIINRFWLKIPKRFKNIELDEYIIMPNHLHGIIVINHIGRENRAMNGRENRAPTLGQIVAYFKYQSTKYINNTVGAGSSRPIHAGSSRPIQKIFQRNYYEHIIRNEIDLNKIREYIWLNPKMWDRDRNNPENWNMIL